MILIILSLSKRRFVQKFCKAAVLKILHFSAPKPARKAANSIISTMLVRAAALSRPPDNNTRRRPDMSWEDVMRRSIAYGRRRTAPHHQSLWSDNGQTVQFNEPASRRR